LIQKSGKERVYREREGEGEKDKERMEWRYKKIKKRDR